MSDTMEIRESETGVVRVFHLDLPDQAVERFTVQAGTGEWPLKYGLGAEHLKPESVDVVKIEDLGEMPLSAYLTEAHGVTKDSLGASAAEIDGLKGHVVVLPSYAFERRAQTLTVRQPLRWVGSFEENRSPAITPKLASKSAEGSGTASAGSAGGKDHGFGRWLFLAIAAILVFAFVLFALV